MRFDRLNRLARLILPRSARTLVRRHRQRPRPGLPPTLEPTVIDRVAGQLSASRLHATSYQSLTTWKDTGTFRVTLRFDEGRVRRVIYKRAVYSLDEIPANEGLPVRQGPPEQLVAQTTEGPLVRFIPRCYWVEVDESAQHFDYVWEDLGVDHEHFLGYPETNSMTDIAGSLVAMHGALRTQFDGNEQDFLHYDQPYCEELWEYTIHSLTSYADQTGDRSTRALLGRREEVGEVFLDPTFHKGRPVQPIHGDCNGTNIWVHSEGGELRMKAVDWEWAGYGLPHADIISIVRWSSEMERDAFVERYCASAGLTDVERQRRWLRRANMERAVLDAGFLSKQYLDPKRSQEWFRGFIAASLEQLLAETEFFVSGKAGR